MGRGGQTDWAAGVLGEGGGSHRGRRARVRRRGGLLRPGGRWAAGEGRAVATARGGTLSTAAVLCAAKMVCHSVGGSHSMVWVSKGREGPVRGKKLRGLHLGGDGLWYVAGGASAATLCAACTCCALPFCPVARAALSPPTQTTFRPPAQTHLRSDPRPRPTHPQLNKKPEVLSDVLRMCAPAYVPGCVCWMWLSFGLRR